MLAARGYKTKKELKAAIGRTFKYTETSFFGPEGESPLSGTAVVGPTPDKRKWYAQVWTDNDGVLIKVT